jgi:hypothetical protein
LQSTEESKIDGGEREQTCPHCCQAVIYLPTYISGQPLLFTAIAQTRAQDTQRTGWIPGLFTIGDRRQLAWAPIGMHDEHTRRTYTQVRQLHLCGCCADIKQVSA